MIDIKVRENIKDLKTLTKRYPDVSQAASTSKMTKALALLERIVEQKTPEGAGPVHLRDTIHGKTIAFGHKVSGILGTPSPYGEPVEFGARPHFPPVAPLQHWVEKKLGLSGSEAKSVAYAIASSIAKHGTEGAHMFEEGFDEARDDVLRILRSIPDEIVRRIQ